MTKKSMRKEITFLLVCLGVLGFFLYKTLQEGRWVFSRAGMVLNVSDSLCQAVTPRQISRIEIRRADNIIVFQRRPAVSPADVNTATPAPDQAASDAGGSWFMVDPVEARVNQEKIQTLVGMIVNQRSDQKLKIPLGKDAAQQEALLKNFGMARPALGVFFEGDFGEQSLWLGESAPQDQGVYARWMHEQYVELVPTAAVDLLSCAVDDWRESRVFFEPAAPVVDIVLAKKEQTLHLLSDGRAIFKAGELNSSEPEIILSSDPAARREVMDFLNNVACVGFWDAAPEILSRQVLMTIRLVRQTAAPGRESKEEEWILEKVHTSQGEKLILSNGQESVKYVMESKSFEKYLVDLSWILERDWTDIKADACNYFSLEKDGGVLEFLRQDGVWRMTGHPFWNIDQQKAGEFLQNLLGTKMNSLEACREFSAQDSVVLRAGRDSQDSVQITLRKTGDRWVAHRKGDPFVFSIREESLNLTATSRPFYWRDRTVLNIVPDSLTGVIFVRENAQSEFVRQDGEWYLVKPKKGLANQELLDRVLAKLIPLKAVRFLSEKESAAIGEFKPRLKLVLYTAAGKQELWLGKPVLGGLLARLPQDDGFFVAGKDHGHPMLWRDPIYLVSEIREDSNRDGRIDQWIHYQEGRRLWMASDDNQDGQPDSKIYWRYDHRGGLVRMDADTNNDGRIDQKTYFREGVPYRQEDDADGNGKMDAWTTFAKGIQAVQRLDTNGDGKPDMIKKLEHGKSGDIVGAQVDQDLDGIDDYLEKYEGGKILREPLKK